MKPMQSVIGQSSAFFDAIERASAAAALNRPVLVIGERGTGKELVAERLHRLSARWAGPLITINCAALAETLIEAELFGHEAGAFTGAARARAGRFEDASGGTLFLDELATLSAGAQERLLRAVEYGEITRIGANRALRVDVRIIAATNEHLPSLVEAGRFRADLLDRLAFEVITLPPLRAREGDVPLLADHYGRRMASEMEWDGWPGFSVDALAALEAYDWPGNVRELRNTVERSVYRWAWPDRLIERIDFDPFASPWAPRAAARPAATGQAAETVSAPASTPALTPAAAPALRPGDLRGTMTAFERALIDEALTAARHNQREAARATGLSYDQFRHLLRRHGLIEGGRGAAA